MSKGAEHERINEDVLGAEAAIKRAKERGYTRFRRGRETREGKGMHLGQKRQKERRKRETLWVE